MKLLVGLCVLVTLGACLNVPTLHSIQQSKLTDVYGGVYNANCGIWFTNDVREPMFLRMTTDSFVCSFSGTEMCVVSDVGPNVTLHSMSAFNSVRYNGLNNVFHYDSAPLIEGHTYSVMVARADLRALYAFTVIELDQTLVLDWAVLLYQNTQVVNESSGFDWNAFNN
eukprot:TRINITY_DN865_c0_g1_i1.p1 TRINITY_DN865_c0_g1~~TRINITY_DN865_c0_g1_i1.p1  ORF type:complete len:168 (+),score=20.35 TRINITY_DN865_c0_g1_i1:109-612(+)